MMTKARRVGLTREEWLRLRIWIDEHGYNQQRDEPHPDWLVRTDPIAYAYAQIVEAACDHVLSDTEPYCAKCSMLMDICLHDGIEDASDCPHALP